MIQTDWRPSSLDEFVGQQPLVRQLRVELEAARRQRRAMRHMIFSGPQGLGKSSLAHILSLERWGFDPIVLMGKGLTYEQLSYTLLTLQSDGYGRFGHAEDRDAMKFPVIVLDECEAVRRDLFEILHPVLEPGADGRRIFMATSQKGETGMRWCREHTWILLTNFVGDLVKVAPATVSRFPIQHTFEWYSEQEMVSVIRAHSDQRRLKLDADAVQLVARRSNGMPRQATHLIERAGDFASVLGDGSRVTVDVAQAMFESLGIDENGLDRQQQTYLKTLAEQPTGRMAVQALASILGLDPNTLMYTVEPVLMKRGLICRTSGGREITPTGRKLGGVNINSDPFWNCVTH
jgi:Holliday junction DNA helicase RuvB